MATAPAKKKTAAPNPLDDLDDLGSAPAPAAAGSESPLGDASPSDPMGVPDSSPATESPAAPLAPPAPILRTVIRGLCGLLVVAAVAIFFLNPSAPMTAARFDAASTVVVSVVQGSSYGQALVHLGDGAVGEPLADDESLKQALSAALGDASKSRLLIKASGGVNQREVERVGRIVLQVVAPERKIEIFVAPLESPP
jgi:hypothetical protein